MPAHANIDISSGSDSENELRSSPRKKIGGMSALVQEPTQDELDYRCEKYPDVSRVKDGHIACTSCGQDMKCFVELGQPVFFNPFLQTLLCKKCSCYYANGDFSLDEDGTDKYCRWCGQGGDMFCCSSCTSAFCKACLKRNLSRKYFREVKEADSWDCFICNVKPLWDLRAICWAAQNHINALKQHRRKRSTSELSSMVKRKVTPQKSRRRLHRRQKRDSSTDSSSNKQMASKGKKVGSRDTSSSRTRRNRQDTKDSGSSDEDRPTVNGNSRNGRQVRTKSMSAAGPSSRKDVVILGSSSDSDFVIPKSKVRKKDLQQDHNTEGKDVKKKKSLKKYSKDEPAETSDDEPLIGKVSSKTVTLAVDDLSDADKCKTSVKQISPITELSKGLTQLPVTKGGNNSDSSSDAEEEMLPEILDDEAADSAKRFIDSQYKVLKKIIRNSFKSLDKMHRKRTKLTKENHTDKLLGVTGKVGTLCCIIQESLAAVDNDIKAHTKMWKKKVIADAKAKGKLPRSKKEVIYPPLSPSDVERDIVKWDESRRDMEESAVLQSSDDERRKKAGKKARKKRLDDSPPPSEVEGPPSNIASSDKECHDSIRKQKGKRDQHKTRLSGPNSDLEETVVSTDNNDSPSNDKKRKKVKVNDKKAQRSRSGSENSDQDDRVTLACDMESFDANSGIDVSALQVSGSVGRKSIRSTKSPKPGEENLDSDDGSVNRGLNESGEKCTVDEVTDYGSTLEYELLLKGPAKSGEGNRKPDAATDSSDSDFPMATQKPISFLTMKASGSREKPGSESDDESDGEERKSRPGPKSRTLSPSKKKRKKKTSDEDKENDPTSTRVRSRLNTPSASDTELQASAELTVVENTGVDNCSDTDFETANSFSGEAKQLTLDLKEVSCKSPDPFSDEDKLQGVSNEPDPEKTIDDIPTPSLKRKSKAGPKSRTRKSRDSFDELNEQISAQLLAKNKVLASSSEDESTVKSPSATDISTTVCEDGALTPLTDNGLLENIIDELAGSEEHKSTTGVAGNDNLKLTEEQLRAKQQVLACSSDDDDFISDNQSNIKTKSAESDARNSKLTEKIQPKKLDFQNSSGDEEVPKGKGKKRRLDSNPDSENSDRKDVTKGKRNKKAKSKTSCVDLTAFNDTKLTDVCAVKVCPLSEELITKFNISIPQTVKSRKKPRSLADGDSDTSISRLTNLKNLRRGKSRRRPSTDLSPTVSNDEETTKTKSASSAKKKEKPRSTNLVNFLNEASDNSDSDARPGSDDPDSTLPLPVVVKGALTSEADDFWKKKVLESSTDDVLSENEDEEKKVKKTKDKKKKVDEKKSEDDGNERKKNKDKKQDSDNKDSDDSDTLRKKESSEGDDKKKKHKESGDSEEDEEKKKKKKKKKRNDLSVSDSDDSTTVISKKKTSSWRNDRLLRGRLSLSDSSDEERREAAAKKRGDKARADAKAKGKETDEMSSDEDVAATKVKNKKTRKTRSKIGSDSDSSVPIVASSSSDSDDLFVKKKPVTKRKKKSSSSSDSDAKKKKRRRRIKAPKDSSDSDEELDETQGSTPGKGRKNIRRVMKEESVGEKTRRAAKEEEDRKKRIAEKQKLYNDLYNVVQDSFTVTKELVLDFDPETKEELVKVAPAIVKKLKPHQVKGVKFMWDACFESLEQVKKTKGSGCILAHCMGLGKTFQVVTLVHTLLSNSATKVKTVLVVCPLSTVLNWVGEFKMWLKDTPDDEEIEIFEMSKSMSAVQRKYMLEQWQHEGGVMVMGYDGYRNLSRAKVGQGKGAQRVTKNVHTVYEKALVDPGPDLVVCDEGHLLKNESTSTSKAFSRIRTLRRILLTGTPLQNNLKEYHCMVNFVKPNLLGTSKEFQNRFVNPICNGQFEDSTAQDVKVMKRRAHVLHKMLEGSIQRFDYTVLTPFLPPKFEYVISIRLSEVQAKIYEHYLENFSGKSLLRNGGKNNRLFPDWQYFQRICTHPKVMMWHTDDNIEKQLDKEEDSEGSLKDFIDDDDDDTSSAESSTHDKSDDDDDDKSDNEKSAKEKPKRTTTRRLRGQPELPESPIAVEVPAANHALEWWKEFCTDDDLENMASSGKLRVLFGVLTMAENVGDKVLVFSQSLGVLNLIEYFLERIDEDTQKRKRLDDDSGDPLLCGHTGSWAKGLDYFRLDGSVAVDTRSRDVKMFNNPSNIRARLFLISTKAGGLGINLYAANRVVIFDASWNPSHDVQSLFRVYRFGQKKPCYIYRLVAYGTMEEKVYERQVTKLSLACRVVDEQQIERHYSTSDMAALYTFESKPKEDRPTPILPKDRLLADLMNEHRQWFETYHEHDSLLENVAEEELNEEERKAAWEDYETEKKGRLPVDQQMQRYISNPALVREMLRKQNPTASDQQIDTHMIEMMAMAYKHQALQTNTSLPPLLPGQLDPFRAVAESRVNQMNQVRLQQQLQQQLQQMYRQQAMNMGPNPMASQFAGDSILSGLMQGNYLNPVAGHSVLNQGRPNYTTTNPPNYNLPNPPRPSYTVTNPMADPKLLASTSAQEPRIKVRSLANLMEPKMRLDTVPTQQKIDINQLIKPQSLVANPLFAGNKPALKPSPKIVDVIDLN